MAEKADRITYQQKKLQNLLKSNSTEKRDDIIKRNKKLKIKQKQPE